MKNRYLKYKLKYLTLRDEIRRGGSGLETKEKNNYPVCFQQLKNDLVKLDTKRQVPQERDPNYSTIITDDSFNPFTIDDTIYDDWKNIWY